MLKFVSSACFHVAKQASKQSSLYPTPLRLSSGVLFSAASGRNPKTSCGELDQNPNARLVTNDVSLLMLYDHSASCRT